MTELEYTARRTGVTRKRAESILSQVFTGSPPSLVDAAEGLRSGTAHDLVIARWADIKAGRWDDADMVGYE